LTLIERKRGAVEEAQRLAERALEAARATEMVEYVRQARAHLAWVKWRVGDLAGSERLAREVWDGWDDYWNQRIAAWFALWPLIGVALARTETAKAIDYVRILLDPTRQPHPAGLEEAMRRAVAAWTDGEPEAAAAACERVAALARLDGYL
jgi:hypothetical protein